MLLKKSLDSAVRKHTSLYHEQAAILFAVTTPTHVKERGRMVAKACYFSNTTCIEEM